MGILVFAGCAEVLMVYALKKAQGFKNKLWSVLMVVFAACSLGGLSLAMQSLDMGIAYSIWVAFGSIGSILLGAIFLGDKVNRKQLFYMALIIVAVIGLKIS